MTTVYDVPGIELIKEITKELKQNKNIIIPEYANYVKTGAHKERAPQQEDWYHIRMASILRRIYLDGPTGTEALRTYYGGRKNRGVRPHKHVKASGKIIRNCLQALEKEGLIKKEKKGRIATRKGVALLNKASKNTLDFLKQNPRKRKPKSLSLAKEKTVSQEPKRKDKKEKGKEDGTGRDKTKKNK
jgi:small subunit ribosomal protein S19e